MTTTTAIRTAPDFAIVGAPKTGTTALYTWLAEHPRVYMPPRKELHFFDQNRERGTSWYLEQFAAAGERLAGEATTTYLGHPTAIEELAAVNPAVRLIAIVRDPVARAWSDYHYKLSRGWLEESFAAAITRELAGLLHGHEQPGALVHESRYGHHLERAARHVPADRMLVLRIEDLEATPGDAFARVCAFLGVDADFSPASLGQRANETHRMRYPRLTHALMRSRLDRFLTESGRQRLAKLLAKKGYEPLDPDLAAALREVFEPDQALLARFLERADAARP